MRRLSYVTHDSARCLPVSMVLMYGTIPTEPFFVEDHPPGAVPKLPRVCTPMVPQEGLYSMVPYHTPPLLYTKVL